MEAARTPLCRSIFACGEAPPTPERYTQVWIDLINQIEQSKEAAAAVWQRYSRTRCQTAPGAALDLISGGDPQ